MDTDYESMDEAPPTLLESLLRWFELLWQPIVEVR
jgi:hypothetical protein